MNRIRELREQRGWRQEDLAALIHKNRQSVGNYETGTRGLDVETICQLCDIFGCTADYLLCRSQTPTADLTPEEERLLVAWRKAPDEIRAIIGTALAPYHQSAIESSTA